MVIGDHFGGGDHFDGGDHFGGGTPGVRAIHAGINNDCSETNSSYLRACLHGTAGPQVGEVTCGESVHLSRTRDKTKIRDYMDRRVTSTTWGSLPPCKQALNHKGASSTCSTLSLTLQGKPNNFQ